MNVDDKKALMNAIIEISSSMTRTEGERDLVNEITKKLKEDLGLKPSMVRRLATMYHTQSKVEVEAEFGELIELYESLYTTHASDEDEE